MDKESGKALRWMLRETPQRVVQDLDEERLLALLRNGPKNDVEENVLAHVLRGDRAKSNLGQLVTQKALRGSAVHALIVRLGKKDALRQAIVGSDARTWLEWANYFLTMSDTSESTEMEEPPARRGRAFMGRDAVAMTAAERTKRYSDARRQDGLVRKCLWLTLEAAEALEGLVADAGDDANAGSVVTSLIMATREDVRGT